MTYSAGSVIVASDFNGFQSSLNPVWSTGSGDSGWGQTSIGTVSADTQVTATNWATLVNNLSATGSQTATTLTSRAAPVTGDVVTVLTNVATDIASVTTRRGFAAASGTTSSTWTGTSSVTAGTGSGQQAWSLTWTHTVTFPSADQARYFWNAGGLVRLDMSKTANSTDIDADWNTFVSSVGTLYLSGRVNSAAQTIAGVSYTGFTRIGGSGIPSPDLSTTGWYSLTPGAAATTLWQLNNSVSPYTGEYIRIAAAIDSGSTVLTLTTTWYQPAVSGAGTSCNISGGTATSSPYTTFGTGPAVICRYVPPKDTTTGGVLTNTWGTPVVASSVGSAPILTSVIPSTGTPSGGTTVVITGNNFTNATAVTIGGTAALSFVVNSDNQITAVTPAHVAGTASVIVTNSTGSNTANSLYTYATNYSVRLRASASAYLNRTPASASNRQKFTWSGWIKRGALTSRMSFFVGGVTSTGNNVFVLQFDANDKLDVFGSTWGSPVDWELTSTQVFRDPSSWYHIVLAFDSTNATSSNRVLLYVNGVQITSFATATYPALNYTTAVNNTTTQLIGCSSAGSFQLDGYLAQVNFIDGQALTPSSFGAYNSYGVWSWAQYTGTYGTNGFYLKFGDNSAATAAAIGKDSSGNGNNWTPNGINLTTPASTNTNWDSMTDTPIACSTTESSYCTLSPVAIYASGNGYTLSNANLTYFQGTCTANTFVGSTFALIGTSGGGSGKYYYEITQQAKTTVGGDATQPFILAVSDVANNIAPSNWSYYWAGNGNTADPAGATLTGVNGTAISNGDVIMVAIDLSAGKLYLGKNGTWLNSAVPASGTGACATNLANYNRVIPAVGNGGGNMTNFQCSLNFGQRPFAYTIPTGFTTVSTYNVPTSAITNGAAYMAATLYTGTNATQSITNTVNGVSFQPDLIWIKSRSTATQHLWWDSVRGILKTLSSDTTSAEQTETAGTGLNSFNSNGFTLGTDFSGVGSSNGSGRTYVGWQWKANGAGVTNNNGSITSTVSANPTAGFSVVTYTGTGAAATVGHGLGKAPLMIIVKNRTTAATPWAVYHSSLGNTQYLYLNTTAAVATGVNLWNSTTPTSSVFSIGAAQDTNYSTNAMVAYCFTAVAGYSYAGSYTGNGSADGPFLYTGFKPRFFMWKRTDTTSNWYIEDSSRLGYNAPGTSPAELYPNLNNAEGTNGNPIFLSNGVKFTAASPGYNASGGSYIFFAFAENPFQYASAGSSRQSFTVVISSATQNYIANTSKVSGYTAGISDVVFFINPGVVIGSSSTAGTAFTVDTSWAAGDTVTVVNYGYIVGAGGAGGTAGGSAGGTPGGPNGQPGGSGGAAMTVQRTTTINNQGTVGGGGGGGGGGGTNAVGVATGRSGAGGGGAGNNVGTGGFGAGSGNGSPGTLTTGGAGVPQQTDGGAGGAGGNLGVAGTGGSPGDTYSGSPGGAAGFCTTTGSSAFITWSATGTRYGTLG